MSDPRHEVDPIIMQMMLIRQSRRIKQARLASRMICAQTTVSEMERGAQDPKLSKVRGYLQALDLELFIGEEQPFPDMRKLTFQELIDLYYLMGEELERRVTCSMTPVVKC